MPLLSTFGTASARAFGFAGRATAANFTAVGGAMTSPTTTVSTPVGVTAGDLLILYVSTNGVVGAPSGNAASWASLGVTGGVSAAYVGTATGSANVSFTYNGVGNDSYLLVIIRGVSAAALKTQNSSTPGGTTIQATGFTKAVGNLGILTMIMQYSSSGQSLQASPGFINSTVRGGASSSNSIYAAYAIPATSYVNGANLTWNCTASKITNVLMIELT